MSISTNHHRAPAQRVTVLLAPAQRPPAIVHWALVAFMLTLPFDFVDLSALQSASSLTRLVGLLFFGVCVLFPRSCFRRPPTALWWFAGYVAVFALQGCFLPAEYHAAFVDRLQTLLQLLVFCWIATTLFQDARLTQHALLAFILATVLAATAMLLGLPGFVDLREGRVSTMGANPNGLAGLLALTAHALLGLGLAQGGRPLWRRMTWMALALVPLTVMVATGSRGGLLAFLGGVSLYALPLRGTRRRLLAFVVMALAVVAVVTAVLHDEVAQSRLEKSYYKGDTAQRDRLYAAAETMIAEQPLLGWQPIVLNYELGARTGRHVVDAHNLYLHLLMEGGVVGALPFLVGLGCCVWAAWTARAAGYGLLPLVWMVTLLLLNGSGTWLTSKLLWCVVAFTLAAAAGVRQETRTRQQLRTLGQHPSRRENT